MNAPDLPVTVGAAAAREGNVMTRDAWGRLYGIATGEEGGPARIEPDPDSARTVTLVWPDGSRSVYSWRDGDWHAHESLNRVPGDIAARDAL